MLRTDLGVVVPARGELSLQQRFPRQPAHAVRHGWPRRLGRRLTERLQNLRADLVWINQERFQHPVGDALALAHDAQQEVLRARRGIAETLGLVNPEQNDFSRSRGEAWFAGVQSLAAPDDEALTAS